MKKPAKPKPKRRARKPAPQAVAVARRQRDHARALPAAASTVLPKPRKISPAFSRVIAAEDRSTFALLLVPFLIVAVALSMAQMRRAPLLTLPTMTEHAHGTVPIAVTPPPLVVTAPAAPATVSTAPQGGTTPSRIEPAAARIELARPVEPTQPSTPARPIQQAPLVEQTSPVEPLMSVVAQAASPPIASLSPAPTVIAPTPVAPSATPLIALAPAPSPAAPAAEAHSPLAPAPPLVVETVPALPAPAAAIDVSEPVGAVASPPPLTPAATEPSAPAIAAPPAASTAAPERQTVMASLDLKPATPLALPQTAPAPPSVSTTDSVCLPSPERSAQFSNVGRLARSRLLPRPVGLDAEALGRRISEAALAQTEDLIIYTARYQPMAYPLGDVMPLYGACIDVVIRAYRTVGIDLQEEIQKGRPVRGDTNIDHRRTENLRRFLERAGASLPITQFPENYKPGDIVTYHRPFSRVSISHIAVVTHVLAPSGRPMIVHNRGYGPQLEDALFVDRITGHYRYAGQPPSTRVDANHTSVPPARRASRAAATHAADRPSRTAY